MTQDEFKLLFSSTPDKYPFVFENRHPRILDAILTYWDIPIEAEAYFGKLLSSADAGALAPDAKLDLLNIREIFKLGRLARRPKAPQAVLRDLSPDRVNSILSTLAPPTQYVVATMRSAIDLANGNSPHILKFFTQNQMSCNQRDLAGLTALMACAQRGSEQAALILIRAGCNPHIPDSIGNTALHWAVMQNRRRLAELLLYFGADPNTPNAAGASPYALSAVKDDSTIAQRLYEYGGDIASQDTAGNTPLHKAIVAGSIENVWLLLLAGSAQSARNKLGQTAAELADKNPEIQRIMGQHLTYTRTPAL